MPNTSELTLRQAFMGALIFIIGAIAAGLLVVPPEDPVVGATVLALMAQFTALLALMKR